MKILLLLTRRVGHFVAVLVLSSLLLAGFLWISPGSPGRPTEPIDWATATVGQTRACLDRSTCGVLAALPSGVPQMVAVTTGGQRKTGEARYCKAPGPGFAAWFVGEYWGGLLAGDVGTSSAFQEPVVGVVLDGAGYTLGLVAAALVVSLITALLFVALLVWLPFPALRGALRAVLLVFSITPVFILGYVLQTHGVLPYALTPGVVAAAVGILFVGDGNLAEVFLQLETEVRTLRNRDYIHAAALRGASPWKHMLPGLLLPLSSISAGKVAFLLGSVVIAERLFRVPGLGEASLAAAKDGDAVLLLTLTLFITGVVALVALARDLLEVAVDPRLRRSRQDGG